MRENLANFRGLKFMFSLKDKIAVITGGGSGIGLASARRFVEAGATVIIACRSDSTEIAESFGASWIGADVSNPDQVKNLMDETARRHGRIDVVVNNAGWGDVGVTIADIFAYRDPSSFSRPFMRWAGCAPRQFRAAQRAGINGNQH